MMKHTSTAEISDGPFQVPGFSVGHWTHPERTTGCTVLLADRLVPAAVEVRGGAPGTRETDLLHAGRTVQGVDAVLLTGGSAFGLAAADGVMQWLREHDRGFPTSAVNVPIVSGAVIFDLVGDNPDFPDPAGGYEAARQSEPDWSSGRKGAGTGAMVSKALGRENSVRSGIGVAQVRTEAGAVAALFINNAFSDVVDDVSGNLLTTPGGGERSCEEVLLGSSGIGPIGENTVIGAVVVDRPVDHHGLTRLVVAAHSGLARVVRPSHTPADGDTVFALSTDTGKLSGSELMQLSVATQIATARAIVNSVRRLDEQSFPESEE